jgi:hypothetical protein
MGESARCERFLTLAAVGLLKIPFNTRDPD